MRPAFATLVLAAAPAAQIDLDPPQLYPTGPQPYALALGRLDGGPFLDVATADSAFSGGGPDGVSVLLGSGGGVLGAHTPFSAGSEPYDVCCADLDGDGDEDLAVANDDSHSVSILRNVGNGTFATPQNYFPGSGPRGITACDLDADGDFDLAVACSLSNTVRVLRNDGAGGFTLDPAVTVGSLPLAVTCGDFDGDLDPDVAVANWFSKSVRVLQNDGSASFPSSFDLTTQNHPGAVRGLRSRRQRAPRPLRDELELRERVGVPPRRSSGVHDDALHRRLEPERGGLRRSRLRRPARHRHGPPQRGDDLRPAERRGRAVRRPRVDSRGPEPVGRAHRRHGPRRGRRRGRCERDQRGGAGLRLPEQRRRRALLGRRAGRLRGHPAQPARTRARRLHGRFARAAPRLRRPPADRWRAQPLVRSHVHRSRQRDLGPACVFGCGRRRATAAASRTTPSRSGCRRTCSSCGAGRSPSSPRAARGARVRVRR